MQALSPAEKVVGCAWRCVAMGLGIIALILSFTAGRRRPGARPNGELAASQAPLMRSIVPLIFLLFVLPGVVYGYVSGTVKTHRDIVSGMTNAMSGMGYYIVMAFFASLFIAEFGRSNLGCAVCAAGCVPGSRLRQCLRRSRSPGWC